MGSYIVPKLCPDGAAPNYPPRCDTFTHGQNYLCGGYFSMQGAYPLADCTSCKAMRDVERLPGRRAGDEFVRLLIEAVHLIQRAAGIDFAAQAVELVGQFGAVFQAVDRHAAGQLHVVDLEIGGVRVAFGFKRIVRAAEVVRPEVAGPQADAHGIRHGDVGRHAGLAAGRSASSPRSR